MESVYLIAFFIGLGFAVLSGLLSGVFGGGDHDGAGADADAGGSIGDVHGSHIDVQGGHDVHFPLLSPVTISTFIASFGGMGVIGLKVFEWPLAIHLPVSIGTGVGVAGMVFYLFYKIFGRRSVSSAPEQADLVGAPAQVVVSIPKGGAGQISYSYAGTRFTGSARASEEVDIPQGAAVKIEKVVGGTYFVKKG